MTTQEKVLSTQKRENPWLNIIFNIALPVLILSKGTEFLKVNATQALIIAMLFPLSYGLNDLIKTKKINWISVLGLLNVAFTGGFALLGKTGIWFAFKEAAFPLLIGVFVWASSFTKKPALGLFLLNPQAFQIDKMMEALDTTDKAKQFDDLVKKSTQYLSFSFLISATLNFLLAYKIFTPIDLSLAAEVQSQILNDQIAQMTKWSFVVILIPSMLILFALIIYFGKKFKSITGHALDSYFVKN